MPKLLPRASFLKKIAKGAEKSSSTKSHCVDPSPEVVKKITSKKSK